MTLTAEQKTAIETEFKQWTELQYAGKDKKERQKLGQFFTPPPLTIKMLEKFDTVKDKDILDPTVGAGGLLVACILCGADPNRIYGIELDLAILKVCRRRLLKYGVPPWHIKEGNALDPTSYEFEKNEQIETFAVVDKQNDGILLSIVNNKKLVKEKKFVDKAKLKDALIKLKNKKKNIKILKLAITKDDCHSLI